MGLLARLHRKLDRSGGPDACWPFVGAQSRGARRETTYGSLKEGAGRGKNWRVNRLVLLLVSVPDAAGLPEAELIAKLRELNRRMKRFDAAHSCDFGPCGNPSHLSWKPHRANVQEQAHRRAMGGRIDPVVSSEMLWLAAKAGAELRAERAGVVGVARWWPEARDAA